MNYNESTIHYFIRAKRFLFDKSKKKKKEEKKYYKRKNVITLRNKTTLDIMKQIKIKNYFQI